MQTIPILLPRRTRTWLVLATILLIRTPSAQPQTATPAQGPKNGTLLLIRHAEKPDAGEGLTPAGEERAKAYVAFFQNLEVESQPAKPQVLVATADSDGSHRPRLTLEPLSKALGLPIETPFKNKDFAEMADSLRSGKYDGKVTLVCWRHGVMYDLLKKLGADPDTLLPKGKWPEGEYDWLLELRYDAQGRLQFSQRVEENLNGVKAQAPAASH